MPFSSTFRRLLASETLFQLFCVLFLYLEIRQAYRWMQGKFALNEDQAHIAKFSEYMCDQLIAACNQVYENLDMAA